MFKNMLHDEPRTNISLLPREHKIKTWRARRRIHRREWKKKVSRGSCAAAHKKKMCRMKITLGAIARSQFITSYIIILICGVFFSFFPPYSLPSPPPPPSTRRWFWLVVIYDSFARKCFYSLDEACRRRTTPPAVCRRRRAAPPCTW